MTEQQFMRALVSPYWCAGSPLQWHVDGVGIAHFAQGARVGMFNLCYLMLQRNDPPPSANVYRHTDLQWAIRLAGGTYHRGYSLEQYAALHTLQDFSAWILPVTEGKRDYVGGVPWATLNRLCKGVLA